MRIYFAVFISLCIINLYGCEDPNLERCKKSIKERDSRSNFSNFEMVDVETNKKFYPVKYTVSCELDIYVSKKKFYIFLDEKFEVLGEIMEEGMKMMRWSLEDAKSSLIKSQKMKNLKK